MAESSKTAVMKLFQTLSDVGQSVMDDLENVRVDTLLAFDQFLSQANMMRTRADRICGPGVLGRFVLSDMNGVDLANTTATVRADIGAATLKERGTFVASPVKGIQFSANKGTYQQLANTYKVMSQSGIPTGTFEIEYVSPIMGNLVVFDLVVASADYKVQVFGVGPDMQPFAADWISYTGYRVCAWLPQKEMPYLRIVVTPTNADVAGGLGYTFGLTDLNSSSLTYHLASDLVMKPIALAPGTTQAIFRAPVQDGLAYFLSFNGTDFFEVNPDDTVTLPGYSAVTATATLDTNGKLSPRPAADLLPFTLAASDAAGNDVAVVLGFPAGKTPASQCIVETAGDLYLKPFNATTDQAKQFSVSYVHGPSSLTAWLRVKLSAGSNITTPVFSGAYLEETT